MPNRDAQWIIGTMIVLAGLLVWRIDAGFAAVHGRIDDARADLTERIDDVRTDLTARIDDVRADLTARIDRIETRIDRIETRLDGFDERLRAVEIAFGKVDQRLLTIERVVIRPPEPPGE